MRFGVGQIVKCHRPFHQDHMRLRGAVGEIKEILDPLLKVLLIADYVVYFPAFHAGYCRHCDKRHEPLLFAMADFELTPVDDPDAGVSTTQNEELDLHG